MVKKVAMPPVNVSPPVLTGEPHENAILTTTDGVWDAPYYLTFYWMRGNSWISGVGTNSRTYKVAVTSDRGFMISVRVRAQYSIGDLDDASSTSNAIGPILADPATNPPINVSAPVLTGNPNVNSLLTTTNGVWENSPSRYDYWWKRNGMGIGGSDIFSATYRLVDADLGSIISVEVQAFNEGGYQMSPLSSGVGPIMPDPLAQPPVNRIPPMLYPADAPGVVGTYIQTTNGGWDTSNPPVVLEWLRDGSPIIGETEYFYLLAMADVGAMISSAATASNATGSTRAPSSNSIGPITGPLQEEGEEEDMNLIINGNFAINQRGYAQTGLPPIGPDGYGHDRWKAGPSGFCTYQFTQALPDTAIRIITGTLVQVVEGGVIADGPHTLSWDGTAQARVYQGAPTGAYAPSPITTPPLNAGANTTVEFSGDAGTLTKVKFEAGEVATPFNRETLAKSMADCQRYYQVGQLIQGGSVASVGVVIYHSSMLPVVMRAVPTVTGTPVTESNVTYSTAGSYGSSSIYIGWTSGALGAYVGVASFTASAEL